MNQVSCVGRVIVELYSFVFATWTGEDSAVQMSICQATLSLKGSGENSWGTGERWRAEESLTSVVDFEEILRGP